MHFKIWTIQLAKWRAAKERGIPLIDITVKSGIQTFAPGASELYAYKAGNMSEAEYEQRYIERMRLTLTRTPEDWEALLLHPEAVFACYCREGAFCHRHIFTRLYSKYLIAKGHTVELMGEFH